LTVNGDGVNLFKSFEGAFQLFLKLFPVPISICKWVGYRRCLLQAPENRSLKGFPVVSSLARAQFSSP